MAIKSELKSIYEGYLDKVSENTSKESIPEQMGFKNISDLKVELIGIEEFLNNNPASTQNKFANADEAVQRFHNLKSSAEGIKEELRDILLRVYNLESLIKKYEGTD